MPLKAKVNSQTVISVDYSDEGWEELKKACKSKNVFIILPCCESSGYPRTSKLGTKHFVHKVKGDCNWAPESIDHLKLKEIIYKTCKEKGWNAETEYKNNGWIADVFCYKGNIKFAFEVQLSRQSINHAIERQKKYEKDGVNAVWLYKGAPNYQKFVNNVPAISLKKDDTKYYVFPSEVKKIELFSFVEDVLAGNIKYKKRATLKKKQVAALYRFDIECWGCHHITPIVVPYSFCTTRCGIGLELFGNMQLSNENLGRSVSELQREGIKELSNMGTIKKRFSKTMDESYWSNGCKYCNTIIGEFFLPQYLFNYFNANPNAKPALNVTFELGNEEIKTIDFPHWCLKSDEGFCDE